MHYGALLHYFCSRATSVLTIQQPVHSHLTIEDWFRFPWELNTSAWDELLKVASRCNGRD